MPETATNTVSDDPSLREAVPESHKETDCNHRGAKLRCRKLRRTQCLTMLRFGKLFQNHESRRLQSRKARTPRTAKRLQP